MLILVACEESQAVCTAFREIGHEAYSCDLLPCSGRHPEWHLQMDVIEVIKKKPWDLIIAFPPCTHLASSGSSHFNKKSATGDQQRAIKFFLKFTRLKCKRVAIENPIGIMSTIYRRPNQIIHPYMFGHPASKGTCLWLKGLPKLVSTNVVDIELKKNKDGEIYTDSKGKTYNNWHIDSRGKKDRQVLRSKTFTGIAEAMAMQWGHHDILLNEPRHICIKCNRKRSESKMEIHGPGKYFSAYLYRWKCIKC